MDPSRAFAAGSQTRGRQALAALARAFRSQSERPQRVREAYLDTFDWLIHAGGATLSAIDERGGIVLCLRDREGSVRHRLRVAGAPSFAHDLPASPLRDALSGLVGCRRLLPVVRLDMRRSGLRVEDEQQKTVGRVVLEHGTAIGFDDGAQARRVPPTIEVAAVRGYAAVATRIGRFLEHEQGLPPVKSARLERVLALAGRAPGGRSSKLRLELDPAQPAEEALRRVLRALFDTMRLNEDGLRRDVDPEFLHDYRVAVRRTRSALGQVKHVLPPAVLGRFRPEFDRLGEATNVLRDLDVHLLGLDAVRETLGETDRPGLDALASWLRHRREQERQRLLGVLDGDGYAALVADWGRFLDLGAEPHAGAAPGHAAGDDPTRHARRPIREVAARRIRRAYRRVIAHGRAIGDTAPPAALHRLRIDGKKLRYLLELFTSVFDREAIAGLVKPLKQLQDNLGDLNDLAVQQEALADFARELDAQDPATAAARRASATMLGAIAERRRAERERFRRCFSEFDDPRVAARFAEALEGGRAGTP
jgi:CHAD domain-containing protein